MDTKLIKSELKHNLEVLAEKVATTRRSDCTNIRYLTSYTEKLQECLTKNYSWAELVVALDSKIKYRTEREQHELDKNIDILHNIDGEVEALRFVVCHRGEVNHET